MFRRGPPCPDPFMVRKLCAVCCLVVALASACDDDRTVVRVEPERVLYDGEPYGDFVLLGDAVRNCMGSNKPSLPTVVLIDGLFECYTTLGWRTVFGCTSEDEIYLVASVVRESGGQLWAHELTHYFGNEREDDPCGAIALENFSLALPDAGPSGSAGAAGR
jgi:hypothetical protein